MAGGGYPKRNRRDEELPVLRLEIEHADGVEVTDPNGQIFQIIKEPERVLSWKPVPGRVSVISGQPAILYRAEDFEAPLTVDEYVGLVGREQEPDEVKALLEHFGVAFDWHGDFYQGLEAWQPKGLRPRIRAEAAARGIGLQPLEGQPGVFLTPKGKPH